MAEPAADRDAYEQVKRALSDPDCPWPDVVTWIDVLIEQARRSPEYQLERDWYRTYHAVDMDEILATTEGRRGFQIGTLYARCQQECGTARPEQEAADGT